MLGAFAIAADVGGTLVLSDRTEVRARAPGIKAGQPSIDVETAPEVRLALGSPRVHFRIAYTPRLTNWDLNVDGVRPLLLHAGSAGIEWIDGRTRLSLREDGAYGGMSFTSLTATPGTTTTPTQPRLDVIPGGGILQYAASTTVLGSRTDLRRWAFVTDVGYQMSGGADAASRAFLPWQRGPLADVAVEYAVTRADRAVTFVSGQDAAFTTGSEIIVIDATEGWRRRWSAATDSELSVGASEAGIRATPASSMEYRTYPVAEASLEHRFGMDFDRFLVRGSARLGPVVNRILGLVDERVQGRVEARWSHQPIGFRFVLTAQQSVPASDVTAITLLQGELALLVRLNANVQLDGGVRELAQRQAQLGPAVVPTDPIVRSTFTQSVVFVGVTLHAPDTRL